MPDQTGSIRVRAPLSDAGRTLLPRASREAIRDEVLDVVVERVARAIAGLRDDAAPALALTEVFPEVCRGYPRPASVEFIGAPGVVARIG